MIDVLHLSVTFKLAYKLDMESYHGLKVIAVPFMPLYFPFKSEIKFPIKVFFFDCSRFQQDHGKSKFTISIFQYNVCIFYNELQNIGVSFFPEKNAKSGHETGSVTIFKRLQKRCV